MVYSYNEGVVKNDLSKTTAILVAILFAITTAIVFLVPASAKSKTPNNAGSIGKVTLDTDIAAGINYGTGISNGEWVVAETQGVQLGARATDRTDGLLDVSGDKGNRVGVYEASTGFDGTTTLAEWNYEWSVDLSNAKGNAAGKTLSDYTLTLEQDYTEQNLFGGLGNDPVALPMIPGVCDGLTDTLCQQSWNPTFGNDDFDPSAEGVYDLRFVLTPSTFNGPPITVAIQVDVAN